MLTEALIDSAVHLGFPRKVANKLVLSTMSGSTKLAKVRLESNPADTMSSLRHDVTSPGGTTAAAINSLTEDQIPAIFARAIASAHQRSIELANE